MRILTTSFLPPLSFVSPADSISAPLAVMPSQSARWCPVSSQVFLLPAAFFHSTNSETVKVHHAVAGTSLKLESSSQLPPRSTRRYPLNPQEILGGMPVICAVGLALRPENQLAPIRSGYRVHESASPRPNIRIELHHALFNVSIAATHLLSEMKRTPQRPPPQ